MKLSRKLIALVAVLGVVTAALAANGTIVRLEQYFLGGVYIGATAPAAASNKLTDSRAVNYDYDFPIIPALVSSGVGGSVSIVGIPVTGAAVGDNCQVSSKGYFDGGLPLSVHLDCMVTGAGLVTVVANNQVVDGGAPDPKDAGLTIRTFSNF